MAPHATPLEAHLRDHGLLTDETHGQLTAEAERVASHLRDSLDRDIEPDVLFAYVYASPTPQLREQAALVADGPNREGALLMTVPASPVPQAEVRTLPMAQAFNRGAARRDGRRPFSGAVQGAR